MDTLIPGFVRKAALWVERNNTLQYMRKFATFTVVPNTDTSRFVDLENTNIKAVEFFRWVGADGEFQYLTQGQARDYLNLEVGTPRGYWLDGVSRLVLSATPAEALNGELAVVRYTSWPTSLSAEHWLLDWAEDVLEAQAMINFAKHARDPELMAFWQNIRDQALPGLYAADEELKHSNWDVRMGGG